jgi:hypothetical protein
MWGWNPESFEAIGTVSAAFIALRAYQYSLKQKQADRSEARRRLAEQVSLTVATDHEAVPTRREFDGYVPMLLSITNYSPFPIHRMAIEFSIRGARADQRLNDIIGPIPPVLPIGSGSSGGPFSGRAYWIFRPDGGRTELKPNETAIFRYAAGFRHANLCISFRDNDGRGWRKYPSGALAEIPVHTN